MLVRRIPPKIEDLMERLTLLEGVVADLLEEIQAQKCTCSDD
jgi:hypothetical protein